MSKGFVYILTNPSMPGLVKIGKTIRSVEGRAQELYQTGVPMPFKVARSIEAPDCHELETKMHQRLAENRVSDAREFFRIEVKVASDALDEEHRIQVEEWLWCFFPDHSIVESDMFVDPATLYDLAHHTGEDPTNMPQIVEYLRPEDLDHARKVFWERRDRLKLDKKLNSEVIQ